jgi:uncharacterized protein
MLLNRAVVFIAAIFLGLSVAAAAGPLEDAAAAYVRGDYTTAQWLFHSLAERGDATAQSNLGSMYFQGQGVPKDYVAAIRWYRLAPRSGH